MSPYEKIRAACIKANPKIEELKFGCIVKNFLKGTAVILKVHKYEGESDCYDVAYYNLPELIVERTPFNNWVILGRPIRLADVLLAIRKKHPMADGWWSDVEGTLLHYDLTKDDLSQQPLPTQEFIASLL